MRPSLAGRAALVTGGSRAIGFAIARALAGAGARLVIAGRGIADGEMAAARLRDEGAQASFIRADVTREEDVAGLMAAAAERLGGLDLACNSAGAVAENPRPLDEVPEAEWARIIGTNLTGTWRCLKHELPLLRGRPGAAVVNVASMMGLVGTAAGISPYVASKHGVVGLTRAAALECARGGPRVNAVCPAFVRSPVLDRITGGVPEAEAAIGALHPLGRVATVEEVAAAVVWLLSEEASFITGVALPVDGGFIAQ